MNIVAYGVTELSGIVTFVPSSKWKQDSTGLLLPDAEGKVGVLYMHVYLRA
jgi:long-subunit acyl-CoA synthetase (AMP-forming)